MGLVIGDAFHPYSQANQASLSSDVLLERTVHGLFFTPVGMTVIWKALSNCCLLPAIAGLFWFQTVIILKGVRERPVKTFAWMSIVVLTFLAVYQLYSIFWISWNFPTYRSVAFYAAGAVPVLIFSTLCALSVRIIKGRSSTDPIAGYLPPWLTAIIPGGTVSNTSYTSSVATQ